MNAFVAAVESIEQRIAADRADPAIDPRCTPVLLHHGGPTDRAVVLFHGFTNCPRQFAVLAQALFARGFTVYVPRLPHHGLRDKLAPALDALSVDELTACAAQAVAHSAGLAAATSVLGLSVGATMVAWLAQTHALERAVAIAPFFSVAHVAAAIEPLMAGALLLAPNIEMWWDPRAKAQLPPAHGYPRFSTHALARCLQLGGDVRNLARDSAPRTARATLVLNAKDPAIDNGAAREVWQLWRERGATVDDYVFEDLDVRHDIIEPTTFAGAASLVYPVLLELLGR